MARRDREINIFNIAFLDVITGAMGAFVLLVLLLAPYYSGSAPRSHAKQEAAQSAVNDAQQNVQKAQQSVPQNDHQAQQALDQARADLDKAKQQLDALKQQIDQLDSQNKRVTALDDHQQQQIAQLEQEVAQSTSQTLDRAEQNMQQADRAVETGDVAELKRLLAQARADLAAAHQQLDALEKELDQANVAIEDLRKQLDAARGQINALTAQLQQTQQALLQAQQQRNQAIAAAQQMQQQLETALQQRNQAVAEANRAKQLAAALKDTFDKSAPVPVGSTIIDIKAEPTCSDVGFSTITIPRLPDRPPTPAGVSTVEDRNDYFARSSNLIEFPISQGAPFHAQYILNIPFPGMRFLFGLSARTTPPSGCRVAVEFNFSQPNKAGGAHALSWQFMPAVSNTHPILVSAIPPTGQSAAPAPEDVAVWEKITQSSGAQR
jgi:tetratricopeptide (TPR) repeat protein